MRSTDQKPRRLTALHEINSDSACADRHDHRGRGEAGREIETPGRARRPQHEKSHASASVEGVRPLAEPRGRPAGQRASSL